MSRSPSSVTPAWRTLLLGAVLLLLACDGSVVEPSAMEDRSPGTVVSHAAVASPPGYALPAADAQRAAIHALQSASTAPSGTRTPTPSGPSGPTTPP